MENSIDIVSSLSVSSRSKWTIISK